MDNRIGKMKARLDLTEKRIEIVGAQRPTDARNERLESLYAISDSLRYRIRQLEAMDAFCNIRRV